MAANYEYWSTMAGSDFRTVLPEIDVPVLILYADPGSGYSPATAAYMKSQLPNAALMGFAAVVKICPGFEYFMKFAMLMADKMNPYISAVIVTNVFSGITGASLSGTQIFCSTMADQFMALGTVNAQALYKVVGMAAMGMDTLPHCPTFVMEAQVCGVTTKESYPYVMVMTVITPIVLALVAAGMAIVGLI